MRKEHLPSSLSRFIINSLFILTIVTLFLPYSVQASPNKTPISGQVYEFTEDSHYEFSEAKPSAITNENNTYGAFTVSGPIANISTKSGVTALEVPDGNLDFYYTYGASPLNTDENTAQLTDDKSKKLDNMTLDSKIKKGVILLQTSVDQKNWVDVSCTTNTFSDIPVQTESFYSTQDIQRINGCFFRCIVAYETRTPADPKKILFVELDKHDYSKHAEVYEFYITSGAASSNADTSETYRLGSKVHTDKFDGYTGKQDITKKDIHYGWDLGDFFVSGYTDTAEASSNHAVFLKNVGDKITLWFRLNQDINALNGNPDLSITPDHEGYDEYFETPKLDFGRGTLILRQTNHQNVAGKPLIYKNYLAANTKVGANTKVDLFEEGDYEVALDYEVTHDKLIDKVAHYRIAFTFSVRNGNCMVFPFDTTTGLELSNSSVTENGFRLDLAKSRYLQINIKRDVLKETSDGLVEDTRFNGPAKDGAKYTKEGIYTITVHNEYTGQNTTKVIYVGTDNVLKAHVTTGLSIPDIQVLLDNGASIADDGTIQLSAYTPPSPTDEADTSHEESSVPTLGIAIGILLIVSIIVIVIAHSKKRAKHGSDNNIGGKS